MQWDGFRVRLLDKTNGTLQREYVVQKRGGRRVRDEDRPKQTPKSTVYLLGELTRAGDSVATLADLIRRKHGDEDCIRKLQGLRSLVKKYGAASVDEASAALLELGLHDYRSLRRYLERRPAAPLSLAQVDPLIRQLTHYRDLIEQKTPRRQSVNIIELARTAQTAPALGHGRRPRESARAGPSREPRPSRLSVDARQRRAPASRKIGCTTSDSRKLRFAT